MEKLIEYIAKKGLKIKGLAFLLGIGTARFYKILEGKANITLAEALQIEDFTGGEITARDFLKQTKSTERENNDQ